MSAGPERRAGRRRLCIPLRVEVREDEAWGEAVWATNVSSGGMGIQSKNGYKPGSRVGLRFRVGPGRPPIELEADVVWCTREEDLLPGLHYYEVGLEFTSFGEGARSQLDRLIEEAELEAAAPRSDPDRR